MYCFTPTAFLRPGSAFARTGALPAVRRGYCHVRIPRRRIGTTMQASETGSRSLSSPEITRETVVKTARLAHLRLDDAEIDEITPEFQKIVGFFDVLAEVDTGDCAEMTRVEDTTNVLREDTPKAFPDIDGIMEQAPSVERDFIRVPKVATEATD